MTLTAFQSGFYLHHLSFESQRPERLALFYSNVMDMDLNKQSDSEWRCEGPGRRIVFVPGENKKLALVSNDPAPNPVLSFQRLVSKAKSLTVL